MKKLLLFFLLNSIPLVSAESAYSIAEFHQKAHYHQVHNHLFQEVSKWAQMYYDHVAQVNLIMKRDYNTSKGECDLKPLSKNEAYSYVKNRLDFFYNQAKYYSSFSKDFENLMVLIKGYIDQIWYV